MNNVQNCNSYVNNSVTDIHDKYCIFVYIYINKIFTLYLVVYVRLEGRLLVLETS
jgi:hypothetical protein